MGIRRRRRAEVMAVVAHPDDEVLGMGGTLWQHARDGHEVSVIICSGGFAGGRSLSSVEEADMSIRRKDAANRSAQILGLKQVTFLNFPDNRFDTIDRLDFTQALEAYILNRDVGIMYTHHYSDVSYDHRIVHECVVTALRPQPGSRPTSDIVCCEVRSSTDWGVGSTGVFSPNYWVRLSKGAVSAKLRAIDCYAEEMRDFPHSRSREALSALMKHRGVQVGCAAAEAFDIVRRVSP